MSEQNPDFPQPNMPRMGRRNAIIAYQEGFLSGGAQIASSTGTSSSLEHSSNISIENRASIDPEGQIAHELAKEVIKHVKIDMRPVKLTSLHESPATIGADGTSPITTFNASVLKEWKKLHESNSKIEGIQAILQEKSHVFTIPPQKERKFLSRAAKVKQRRTRSVSSDKGNTKAEIKSTVTVKPWRNPTDNENLAPTPAERQKIFEPFKLTSVEPTETPNISEAKLKKSFKEKKQKIVNEPSPSNSEESLLFPKNYTLKLDSNRSHGKDPYGGVQAKVDTRWNKWETLTNWKFSSVFERPIGNIDKHLITYSSKSHWGDGPAKHNATTKTKTSTDSTSSPNTPKDSNKIPNHSKLIENFPAAETLKNHPADDKLPLTIGPRYNHKKAWRMINGVQSIRTEMMQERKRFHDSAPSYPYNNKVKYDSLIPNQIERQIRSPPTHSETSPFKSTFYNLQRINNGRIRAPNAVRAGREHIPTIGRRHSSLLNFDLVMRTKSPPIVTTIQAPPSPFLTSNISIYSQMNTIPINGEPTDSNMQSDKINKVNKGKDAASTSQKKEATNFQGKSPVVSKGNKQKAGNSTALPSTRKDTTKRAETTVKNQRTPNKGGTNHPKDYSRQHPKSMMTAQPNPKVARTTKRSSNKYSKIYIGPYSGSDSESEQPNSTFNRL